MVFSPYLQSILGFGYCCTTSISHYRMGAYIRGKKYISSHFKMLPSDIFPGLLLLFSVNGKKWFQSIY